ncbi:hypothetical protein M885DRAFT_572459 [Pelagophyceae sp. CCMP2097]|nr:hypothetical protein M885DRAFT_572459 [Pelagophyceae sp. CCMP2097]
MAEPLARGAFRDGPRSKLLVALINAKGVGLVADADKGGEASIAKIRPLSDKLICIDHRGQTSAKGDTEGASLRYKACVLATTPEMQERALGKLTPKGLAFVKKLPLKVQFVLQTPGALMEMRRAATAGFAPKKLVEYGEEQYLKHAAEAAATRTYTPAAVILELAKLEADAPLQCTRIATLHFDIDLGAAEVTCTCGVPFANTKPCAHIAFGCSKFCRSLGECVFAPDTTSMFRRQYAAGGTWPLPHFDVDEEDLPECLTMPLANPTPRGRPKSLRGKRGMNDAVTKTNILDLTVSDDDDDDDDDASVNDESNEDEKESDGEKAADADSKDEEAEDDDDNGAAEATLPRWRDTVARRATATARNFAELPGQLAV